MSDDTRFDDKIAQFYANGHGISDIARTLGISVITVIGRVRALDLSPPGMGVRRQPQTERPDAASSWVEQIRDADRKPAEVESKEPENVPELAASRTETASGALMTSTETRVDPPPIVRRTVAPPPRPTQGPKRVSAPLPARKEEADEDDEDDDSDEEIAKRRGMPQGWLISEEDLKKLYGSKRYDDVEFKKSPKDNFRAPGGSILARRR